MLRVTGLFGAYRVKIVERSALDRGGTPAERRQLTILFCDLVGSTGLSTLMDPEDLHDLIVRFQEYCVRQIEEAGGFVARFAGDGILAYFGYPAALEDAPERALRAALALRDAGNSLQRPDGTPLQVRVGVATGLVVVGELVSGGAHERAVAGETPNMAARLQALAEPDTVLVSEATKRLTEGLFVFRSRGEVTHRGFTEPTVSWELLGPRATVSRYESRRAGGVSPLVHRDGELAAILDAWSRAKAGPGSVVGVLGDPGMGKSRLLDETRRRLADAEGALWLEAGGASIYDNTPFYVASQIARRLAREGPDGQSGTDADVLAGGGAWTDPGRRDALMALLTQAIRATATRQPTVLVIEDLHWVDPSTLEWLDLIVRGEGARGLLLIYTSRTDVSERWPREGGHRVVELGGLDNAGSAALARGAGGEHLSLAQVNAIVSRAGGVPLYVEELARLVAERPRALLDPELPPTLSDLMTARLEAAGPAKRHAQVASVLGQEFSASLFAAMAGGDEAEAAAALNELAARAVIVRRTSDTYAFRHALVAVAAYDTLLRRERRRLHERVAEIILARHALMAGEQPEVVARHWTQAGRHREALEAWQAAAELATQRRAFHEAEHAYRQALSVLEQAALEDGDRIELTIRAAFNRVVQITQGYSASEAGASSQRVTELAQRVDDRNARAREEQLRWRSVFTTGDYAAAEAIVEEVMALTQEHGPALWRRTFRLRSGIQQGFYTGDLARGERDFLAWEAIQDGAHRGAGDDVLSMGIGALIALMSGRYAVAQDRVRGGFEVAARRGNPYDLAMALHSEACVLSFAGEREGLGSVADRLVRVAADSGFEYAGHLATGWQSVCDLDAGRAPRALQRAAASIRGFDRLGARVSQPFWLATLARAQCAEGHLEDGLHTFQHALDYNPQELSLVPEVWIMRARLNADVGREREAERDLLQAVRAGRRIGSPLFEFRALSELAALSRDPARRARARQGAAALAGLDYSPSDRARFAALTT